MIWAAPIFPTKREPKAAWLDEAFDKKTLRKGGKIKARLACAFCSLVLIVWTASAQDVPKPGSPAPALTFTHLLQAPAGAKVDWPSLHGKVVVLEFWATWCAPCVAEIPVLNTLVASVDSAKVQFISVDDEEPAVVEAFLKKKPIPGWIGIDTSGELFKRFGVYERPTTIVIDPQGRVASTAVTLEHLRSDQLVALTDGNPVTFGGNADPKLLAQFNAAMTQPFSFEGSIRGQGEPAAPSKPLFEIVLSPSEPAKEGERHGASVMIGIGQMDISDAPPSVLLQYGTGVAPTRITTSGNLPEALYDMHVVAPNADAKLLAQSIELALTSGTGLHIEHHSAITDAYVLTARPESKDHLLQSSFPGMAMFDSETQILHCMNATLDQLASALEKALGTPVVNETGLSGKLKVDLKISPKDLTSVNEALEKALNLTLVQAKRPIETVTLSAGSRAGMEAPPPTPTAKPQAE